MLLQGLNHLVQQLLKAVMIGNNGEVVLKKVLPPFLHHYGYRN